MMIVYVNSHARIRAAPIGSSFQRVQVFLTVIIQALILGPGRVGRRQSRSAAWSKGIAVLLAQLGTPMTGYGYTDPQRYAFVGLVVGIPWSR